MEKIRVNAEAFHQKLMSSAEKYAWTAGRGPVDEVAIINPLNMDEPINTDLSPEESLLGAITNEVTPKYGCLGTFRLPGGSIDLIFTMARVTLCTPLTDAEIMGTKVSTFPFETFCLSELLYIAYPRDTRTGIMRATTGAQFITGDWDPLEENDPRDQGMFKEFARHRMFAGIGIIMMQESRKILGDILSDDDVVREAGNKELYLMALPNEDA